MKGVILAGGLGTRMMPCTKVTNKHLLPVYNKPMIYYPIQTLVKAGLEDIMIVTGGNNAGDFLRLLGNGQEFGLKHINYTYQRGEGGIAQALSLAEHFAEGQRIVIILGDNVFEGSISKYVKRFSKQPKGARILLKRVSDPQRFGVVELKGKRIVGIQEKPKKPKSQYIVTGVYMYDSKVFDIIRTLKPSWRGELEITHAIREILLSEEQTIMSYITDSWWDDTGDAEAILRANHMILSELHSSDIHGEVDGTVRLQGHIKIGRGSKVGEGSTFGFELPLATRQ